METSAIENVKAVITATIAVAADETNTINLEALDVDRLDVPPMWELELIAPQHDPMNWNQTIAERVLADHGYSTDGEWWDSTADTGYESQSVRVTDHR
ncbi:hypothetical protein P9990_25370 (plasmid) [Prescottella equi]|uniref:hypothetical protein n=1 Tax=Rhodococcus hoagii TaxID=43767 RepID=UPI0025764773|nr:hypothetical protein [Prescottella equi]WJJ14527.1 hypothetical protein P9990_25370 [Prescottella equi]